MSKAYIPAARQGLRHLRAQGGFTLDDNAAPVVRRNLWAVSLAGGLYTDHLPDVRELAEAFAELRTREPRLGVPGPTYLGGWYDRDTGTYSVDLTVLVDDPDEALAFAESQGQDAIYNLMTGKTVRVSVPVD